jgi:hypothetical protein
MNDESGPQCPLYTHNSLYLSMPQKPPTQRPARYPTSNASHLSHPNSRLTLHSMQCRAMPQPSHQASSSSVSGGCGVPLGLFNHSICLNRLLTSLSLICARVSFFFFFFALNFMSELSSAPEFAADAAALLTLLLTLLEPGRESSNRSSETARCPLCVTRPSATCHCSGQRAPTNSSLCEILDTGLVRVYHENLWDTHITTPPL